MVRREEERAVRECLGGMPVLDASADERQHGEHHGQPAERASHGHHSMPMPVAARAAAVHHPPTVSSPPELRLSEVLASGVVVPCLRCPDLDEALGALLAPALVNIGFDGVRVSSVLEAVRRREKACATAIGPVALPHARVPGLDRIVAGLGVNRDGVFDGGGETSFVLAFASPAQSAAEHLRFLARAAQLFRDEDARAHLLVADDRESMLAAIRRTEK